MDVARVGNVSSGLSDVFQYFRVCVPFNLILSLPLNGFAMWLILRASRETLTSDFFSLNLAMSETFFALSSIWLLFFGRFHSESYLEVYMFSFSLLLTARPLFQCCICMEYYAGVLHPVLYLRFKPLRYKLACCCIMWLIILLSCTFNLCTFYEDMYLYVYFIQSVLLFCVMLFCSLSVLRALKRPGPGDKDIGKKKKTNKMKRKAFKIILLIVIFMTLNFFLVTAVIPMQSFLQKHKFNFVFTITTVIALTTGFIQPLLYIHRSGKLPCVRKI